MSRMNYMFTWYFFHDRGDQLPIMIEFYNNMDANELMWVIRIIMRRGLPVICFLDISDIRRNA